MIPSRAYAELALLEEQDLAPEPTLIRPPLVERQEEELRPARTKRSAAQKRKNEEAGLCEIIGQATQAMAAQASVCKREHLDMDDEDTMFALDMRNKLRTLDEEKKAAAQLQIHTLIYNLKYGK